MAFAFENLIAYRKPVDFTDEFCRQAGQFPRGYGFLVGQLNRAALSIAANFAEGNGRFTCTDGNNTPAATRHWLVAALCDGPQKPNQSLT